LKYTLEFIQDEHWWGGTDGRAFCPLSQDSEYTYTTGTGPSNHDMPFFVSDRGRYIWSENPFTLVIKNGFISIDGLDIEIDSSNKNLREAYIAAQRKHFPCDGRKLPDDFFTAPQLNTWMEFTYYPTQDKVLQFAREYIRNGFKPGVFILDEGWHGRYGSWEFDFSRFPDPRLMIHNLHEMGFTVLLWIVPFVCPDGPGFVRSIRPLEGTDSEAVKSLYLRKADGEVALVKWWNGFSAVLDMRDDANRRFLSRQLEHLMNDYGVDGFKFDGGSLGVYNPASIVNGDMPEDYNPCELNIAWNEFGRAYKYHEYKDTYKGGGKNCIQRLRDKWHRWDENGIKSLIPCAINAGLTGHPFICPDMIGGGEWTFNFTPGFQIDEELFVRMAQCSALFPMMQFSWAPWNALSSGNLALCRAAADLHERLTPVIIRLIREAEQSGEPVLRSLEYNYPGMGYSCVTDEFMLGNAILAAPVLEKGAAKRKVIFPEGKWIDAEQRIFEGNSTHELDAPLEKILWFRNADVNI